MTGGDDAYLADLLHEARRIGRFLDGVTERAYLDDELRQYAVMYAITVLGEAARRVSRERREQHPELPWAGMTGMRSVLVHDYGEVRPAAVWKTATTSIPALVPQLEAILENRHEDDS